MEREKFDKATEINEAMKFILENRRDVEENFLESVSVMIRRGNTHNLLKTDFDFEGMRISMLEIFRQCYNNEELDKLKKEFEGI